MSSPAGSGKTTLISSYLDSRKLHCLWYQCDEGDADPATFFYYMGLAARKAAPRYKNSLPLLTPEYLAGIPTFTRRYFEKLYGRLITPSAPRKNPHAPPASKGGFVIVLDNYQDVSPDSPFHDIIATGLDAIPGGVHAVVISRGDPPPAWARLHANDKISALESSDVCFTFEESRELINSRVSKRDNNYIKAVYEKTEGWAAGIILMIESAGLKGTGAGAAADFAYDKVFDYFAGEIFNRTEKWIQDFLLKTAFLPTFSVSQAEKLSGIGAAGLAFVRLYDPPHRCVFRFKAWPGIRRIGTYRKGLNMDNLSEELYQRLMLCHGKLGNKADAARAYNRCLGLFQDNLGIEPSDKTKAIYFSILPKR